MEIMVADIVHDILDRGFRRIRLPHVTRAVADHGQGSAYWPNAADGDQYNRDCSDGNNKQSGAHEISLPRTSSCWRSDAGSVTRCSANRRSGRNTSSKARMLLPMGRVPHISPCHAGGICGALSGAAGGTSSFPQMVMVRSFKSSTRRHPANTSKGS